jgi:HAD superfamily hydrolase (TIGR01549 family)
MNRQKTGVKIRSVIFDMDGVIIDSRELIFRAIEDVLMARGIRSVTRSHISEVTGKPIFAMYEFLAPHLDAYELEREHLEHHDKNMHLLKEYDHVKQVLEYIKTSGYKIGLFTGFNELTYDRLKRFELTDYFEQIVETTQYKEHKPHPEGLYLCMDKLGVQPEETVYIGDGVSDILAGKSAGVRATIGTTQGLGSREALKAAGADYIIDSLLELQGLLAKIEQDDRA